MVNNSIQLIDDLRDFYWIILSTIKEINSNNLLHQYINVRRNLSEQYIYKSIQDYVYNDANFLNDPLFKVRNKYLFSNYIKDQNIINRHPWIIRSVLSRLKVLKRQKNRK